MMLSALPPWRLERLKAVPSGEITSTTRSPRKVCRMSTPTCRAAGALPGTPLTVISDSTVDRSGMATSLGFSKRGPVGVPAPARFQIASAIESSMRSSAVRLRLDDVSQERW
jgi:hypothetical protein